MKSDVKAIFKKYIREAKKDKAHAVLSASGSERWLGCPGSVRLAEKAPPAPDNEHGIRGTNTHTLLEFILNEDADLLDQPEAKAFKKHIGYDEAMWEAADFAACFIRSERKRMAKESGQLPEIFIEKKVEVPGVGFGTSDVILYQPFGLLHVIDYKNGRSVVEPEENTQGLYYAHGAAELFGWDIARVTITIIQPNASHRRGPIRTWGTTVKRLEEAGQVLRAGAKRTKLPDAPLVANPKYCFFCPAKSICPEQRKLAESRVVDRFAKPK